MKNKLILLAVVLACLIPSGVAYASYRKALNAPVDEKTAVLISIDDLSGKNSTFKKEADGDYADQLIRYFMQVRANAQPIATLPDSMTSEKCFKVTVSTGVVADTAEYYFSPDPTTCYLRASDGTAYRIAEEDAKVFITTQYAESIYEAAAMPTLLLSGTYDVAPDQAVWQYKNYTGGYVDADVSELVFSSVESYDLEGGLDLVFDLPPDYCSVRITDDAGNVLYDDVLSNISAFRQGNAAVVSIEVKARWYEDPSRSFCGEMNYSFLSHVTAPAEFYFGVSYLEAGKFTAVTAVNVVKPENIEFSTTMPNAEAPVFYPAGEGLCVGFLPIPNDTPSGLYTATFTYGGTTQESTFEVENGGERTSVYEVDTTIIDSCRTESALAEFDSLCRELMKVGSAEKLYSGSFLEGPSGDYTLLRGFGRSIYLNYSDAVSYVNNGVDYRAADGSAVLAANTGKVVYSGNLVYCGNIVVIEHGWGLKTWYYNLGTVSVKEGDTVSRGDTIGTAGKTGFIGETGLHTAMSVGKTFVSPYDTWEDSSTSGKIMIAKVEG